VDNLHIIAGLTASALLIGWGMREALVEAWDAVAFRVYVARVRRVWRLEVADEDIIAHTGEGCWWSAYLDGQGPREAIYDGYARA
jgi:hypothetical protein